MSRSLILIVIFALITIVLGSPAPGSTSPDWSCGGKKGYVCPGSNCCSSYGWCGTGNDFCGSGCQPQFGSCSSNQPPSAQGGGNKVSPDGTCGGHKGYTCSGSFDGDCCSQYGYCGDSSAYCGTGCQPGFGDCKAAVKSSTKPSTKTSTRKTSTKSSTKSATKSSTKSSTRSATRSSTKSSTRSSTRVATRSSTKSYTKSSTSSSVVPSSYSPPSTSLTSSEPPATSSVYSTVSSSTSSSFSTVSAPATSSDLSSTSSVASSTSSDVSSTSSVESSSTISVTASATPSAPCGPNLLSNPGFEQGSTDWSIFVQGSGGTIDTSIAQPDIPLLEGSTYVYATATGEPVLYTLQDTTGITAGTYVSCSGWVFYNGDNNGNVASLAMEVLVNGNLCASQTYFSGGWQEIESNIPIIVDIDNPQIIFRVYVQNPDSSLLELALDQFSIRYSPNAVDQYPPCGEVLPGSGVSSSATSSATSTVSESSTESSSSVSVTSSTIDSSTVSTASSVSSTSDISSSSSSSDLSSSSTTSSVSSTSDISSSSSSSDLSSSSTTFVISTTASSTSSSAAASSSAPTCNPNLLQNGDFNLGTEDPFSISVANDGGNTQVSIVRDGDIPSDDGTPFLQIVTTFSPTIVISQQITGIPSGTTLQCSMDVLVPAQTTQDQDFSVNFEINGQSCASIGGLYTGSWTTVSNFAIDTTSDDPVSVEITVTWSNPSDYTLDLGLDNLFVWADTSDNAGLGLCPPSPATQP